ncbi:MAG: hypothetical protein GXP38_05220 [Chloroflexi bacterium]|nr:hypothetical protein [Chloroflexota bacterium]
MSLQIRVAVLVLFGLSFLFGSAVMDKGASAAPFQSVIAGTTIHEPLILGTDGDAPHPSSLETGGIPPYWLLALILLLFIPAAVLAAARRRR